MSLSSDVKEISSKLRVLVDEVDSRVDKIKDLQEKLERLVYSVEDIERSQNK